MARTTPLPADLDVRKLVGLVAVSQVPPPDEFYWLALESGAAVVRYNLCGYRLSLRGPRLTPQPIDDPRIGLMKRM